MRYRSLAAVGVMLSVVGATFGQTCVPAWSHDIGRPGVTSSGYVGPMMGFNDGSGEKLYAGGSFSAMGGFVTRGIARWNPVTQLWGPVGGGCYSTNTNYFVAALGSYSFDGVRELLVGGSFDLAGTTPAARLARWNGTRWAAMPGAQPNGAVWAITEWNGKLYIGGGFSSVGAAVCNGIMSFDAEESWQPVGTGIDSGFAPTIFALKAFNDGRGEKLYAGGRFTSIAGVNGMIGRWNGTSWEPAGGGIVSTSPFGDIEAMEVFDNGTGPALYVGGSSLSIGGGNGAIGSVARWNGVRWQLVGADLGGRVTALKVFNDGSGPALYLGGTAQPGINYVAKLVGNAWVTLDGGVGQPGGPPFPSVFGMAVWDGKLFVGGDFDWAGDASQDASGIAYRTSCSCPADYNADGAVDADDTIAFFADWDGGRREADFNGDGGVDADDVIAYFARWDSGC
ncbi:MAG: GC-type dockerin domain-anchored protein [Phycisphaerales bacterium]